MSNGSNESKQPQLIMLHPDLNKLIEAELPEPYKIRCENSLSDHKAWERIITESFREKFSNSGRAYMSFFTNKFRVNEVVGKAVIIHENPDDYRSQPAGDAGKRLACGVVQWSS
jgi:hypothetical protein